MRLNRASPARRAAERIIGEIDRLRALAAAAEPTWDYLARIFDREAAQAAVDSMNSHSDIGSRWEHRARDEGCGAIIIERMAK